MFLPPPSCQVSGGGPVHVPTGAWLVQVLPPCPLPADIHLCAGAGQATGPGCSRVGNLPGVEVVSLFNLQQPLLGRAFACPSPQRGWAAHAPWEGCGKSSIVFPGMETVLLAIHPAACCTSDADTCWYFRCSSPGLTVTLQEKQEKQEITFSQAGVWVPSVTAGIFQPVTSPGTHELGWSPGTDCDFTVSTRKRCSLCPAR